MQNYIHIILFSYLVCEEIIYNHTNNDNNLYFIFTTFRHGARTIFEKEDYFGNIINSPGSLTSYGILQNIEIGNKYKKRYSNFLNKEFDNNEIYIRSSDEERTINSIEIQLKKFFNKTIERDNFELVEEGIHYYNLYNLNKEFHQEMNQYLNFCQNKTRILLEKEDDTTEIFQNEILPFLKSCYGLELSTYYNFCEHVYSAFYEYKYSNDTNNKILKCGFENALKLYNFCNNYRDSIRRWDEYGAYFFYNFFQNIFEYMNRRIDGEKSLRMLMVGGHDTTIGDFMNFFDGLNIIPRTQYPDFAFTIVIELRKYNNDFYIEFYYNDILKYNSTLKNLQNILNNTKYYNLYNYCGIPPWKKNNRAKNYQKYKYLFIAILTGIILVLSIIALIIYLIIKNKKKFTKLSEESQKNKHVELSQIN